jgi:hypothetical protein
MCKSVRFRGYQGLAENCKEYICGDRSLASEFEAKERSLSVVA